MKFEYEKLDANYLGRRVAEEESRAGRRVTRIVLTRREWHEFLTTRGYQEGSSVPQHFQIYRSQRTSAFCDPNVHYYDATAICTLEVVCE